MSIHSHTRLSLVSFCLCLQTCTDDNRNQSYICLQITHPLQLPNAHLLFLALLGSQLIRSRRRTRLSRHDTLRREYQYPRHGGKLHRLECCLLGELDKPIEIGMRGCNLLAILIQKNHRSMVWVITVGHRVGVSAVHIS